MAGHVPMQQIKQLNTVFLPTMNFKFSLISLKYTDNMSAVSLPYIARRLGYPLFQTIGFCDTAKQEKGFALHYRLFLISGREHVIVFVQKFTICEFWESRGFSVDGSAQPEPHKM